MKVSSALAAARDELERVGFVCAASDIQLHDGHAESVMFMFDFPETFFLGEDDEPWAHERLQAVVSAPFHAIRAMCIEGAMIRAAQGDLKLYRDMVPFVMDAIQATEGILPDVTAPWMWNDADTDRSVGEVVDVLHLAEKYALETEASDVSDG